MFGLVASGRRGVLLLAGHARPAYCQTIYQPACLPHCLPLRLPAAEGQFLLSDLLTAQGQTMTIPLVDQHRRPLPGCVAVLSAEELPNTNAVVSTWPACRLPSLAIDQPHDWTAAGLQLSVGLPTRCLCCLAMQRLSSGDAGAGRCQA